MQSAPLSDHADLRVRSSASASALRLCALLSGLATLSANAPAQTVSTVRETEFRSRWVDQQVDAPLLDVSPGTTGIDADAGLAERMAGSLSSFFRTGPVVLRGGLGLGIEYSNQGQIRALRPNASQTSFFIAPAIAALYEREVGPWSVSARYSAGYLYYFDRNFLAGAGTPATPDQTGLVLVEPAQPARTERVRTGSTVTFSGGIRRVTPQFRTVTIPAVPAVTEEVTIRGTKAEEGRRGVPSQTAGLDFRLTLSRLSIRSSGGASFGTGFDVGSSSETDRLNFNEGLTADYQLSEYSRAGIWGSVGYERSSRPQSTTGDTSLRLLGGLYTEHFLTSKTRVRVELGAGNEKQTPSGGIPLERTYTQALVRMTYQPTDKLTLEGSIGAGIIESTGGPATTENGARMVYSLTANYRPTEKISARLYLGLETTSTQPELSLSVDWQPRETSAIRLSAYQLSGAATLSFAQNRLTRGVLGTAQQRLFQRALVSLSAGWEEYEELDPGPGAIQQEPYSFLSAQFSYEFTRWMVLEAYYRSSSQTTGSGNSGTDRENRASLSLRLTF